MSLRPRLVAASAALLAVAVVAAVRDRDGELVRRGELLLTTEATGTLEAVDSVLIGRPTLSGIWDFKVTRLAPEGAEVEAGAPLIGFDTEELDRKIEDQTNQAEEASRQLEKRGAELDLEERDAEFDVAQAAADERKAELAAEVPEELVARKEHEKSLLELARAREQSRHRQAELAAVERHREAELGALRGKRDRARAKVAVLEAEAAKMTVVAPRAGTVVYLADWRGEKVKVGDAVWGRPVISLPDLTALRAVLEVAEVDLGRVAVGQRVRLVLDAHPDHPYGGTVTRVDRSVGTQSANSRRKVARALVALDAVDAERMRPGMRLRAELEVARLSDVVLVPRDALRESAAGPVAERLGWLGSTEVRPRLGLANRELVEVLSGLEPGDRVRRVPESE